VEFPEDLTDDELDEIRNIALNEPLVVNRLVSDDGRVAGINIDLHFDSEDSFVTLDQAHWAWDKKAELNDSYPHLDVYVTGSNIISASFSETAVRDLKLQTPLMYLFVIVLMGVLLRGTAGVVSIVITTMLTIITGMGLAGWYGLELQAMSSPIPVIILTVVISHGVHLMVAYYQDLRSGVPKHDAMVDAIEINLQPVFLTSVSTAIGFFSLNVLADVPPIQQVGNVVGVTICIALVTSLTFLPALVYVLPARVGPGTSYTSSIMGRLAELVIARQNQSLVAMSVLAIFLMSLAPLNVISDQFSKYFSEETHIRADTDFTDQNLGGLYRIEYSLDTGESQGVTDPAVTNGNQARALVS